MARQIIESTDNLPIGKNKINDNFDELYAGESVPNITADVVKADFFRVNETASGFYNEIVSDGFLTENKQTILSADGGTVAYREETGFGYYIDSLATPSITLTTSYTQITIDALGSNILSYLPISNNVTAQLWFDNKITPVSVGGDYDGRLDITVTAKTGAPTVIEFIIDISGGTAGTNKAFTGYIQNIGSYPYDQSLPLDFFTLATFLANGGKLYGKVDSGSLTISRRNIKISKKY